MAEEALFRMEEAPESTASARKTVLPGSLYSEREGWHSSVLEQSWIDSDPKVII